MPTNPIFRWNKNAGQYIRPNGKFVSRAEVRSVIDQVLDKETRALRGLAMQLREGQVTLEVWRASMLDSIKLIHLMDAAAAKGGWAQLSQADYGRVGGIVRKEYAYLEKLARGISSGRVPLDGQFFQRVEQYAQAGRDTYHQVERAAAQDAGFRFESNVLHAADHCTDCLGETARGKVKIGTLIPIGRRQCMRNCRCSFAYFKTKT